MQSTKSVWPYSSCARVKWQFFKSSPSLQTLVLSPQTNNVSALTACAHLPYNCICYILYKSPLYPVNVTSIYLDCQGSWGTQREHGENRQILHRQANQVKMPCIISYYTYSMHYSPTLWNRNLNILYIFVVVIYLPPFFQIHSMMSQFLA